MKYVVHLRLKLTSVGQPSVANNETMFLTKWGNFGSKSSIHAHEFCMFITTILKRFVWFCDDLKWCCTNGMKLILSVKKQESQYEYWMY